MTLHQELTDIILNLMAHPDDINEEDEHYASEAAGAVIAKIVERLPEKKKSLPIFDRFTGWQIGFNEGFNAYHDTLKDLLTEETK